MDRSYDHQIIEAAEVTDMLPIGNKPANEAQARGLVDILTPIGAAEIGTIVPGDNEGQARELTPLKDEPDIAREVMEDLQRENPGGWGFRIGGQWRGGGFSTRGQWRFQGDYWTPKKKGVGALKASFAILR